MEQRIAQKNKLYFDAQTIQDPSQKGGMEKTYRMSNIADLVREHSTKIAPTKSDREIIEWLIPQIPNGEKLFTDYINNGDTAIIDLLNNAPGSKKQKIVQEDEGVSTLGKVGLGALGAIGTLVGGKVGGEVLKGVGKKVYGLTLPPNTQEASAIQAYEAGLTQTKPKITVDTAIKSPLLQKGNKRLTSIVDKFGLVGTRSAIGTQARALANNMFNDTLKPIFQQATDEGVQISYKTLFNQAIDNVNKNAKRSVEQKTAIIDDIKELSKEYKGKTTLENLDLAKRDIANKLPKKYYSGQPMTSTVKDAQGIISDVFRKTVHSTIKDRYGVNSAGLYTDYANLQNLAKMGQKSMTQAGLQGGAGTFLSTAAQELATPATTIVGKGGYKLGELLTAVPDYIAKKGKELIKSGKLKNILKTVPGTMAGATSPDVNEVQSNYHSMMVQDAQEAIKLLNGGKNIPATNTASLLGKNLSKEEKIQALEKIANSKQPEKIVSPLEFLIDKIF